MYIIKIDTFLGTCTYGWIDELKMVDNFEGVIFFQDGTDDAIFNLQSYWSGPRHSQHPAKFKSQSVGKGCTSKQITFLERVKNFKYFET